MPRTKQIKEATLEAPNPMPTEDEMMEAMGEDEEGRIKRQLQKMPTETDAIALLTPQQLSAQMTVEAEKRRLITAYITEHMKEGIDYGPIHIKKDCQYKYELDKCTNKYHWSKDTLFKPGAEKFCSLFRLRAEFSRDDETWEMMGRKPGLICYRCSLYTSNGILVGEGRGSSSTDERQGMTPNNAIKIAEKRAKMDAVLATGGLSDFFTQDLDDMEIDADEPEVLKGTPPPKQPDTKKVMVQDMMKQVAQLLIALGIYPDIETYKTTDNKAIKEKIKILTDLDLTPKNLPQIIDRLEIQNKAN